MNKPINETNMFPARGILSKGNEALRKKEYAKAIELYAKLMSELPGLAKTIQINLQLARDKYRSSRKNEPARVGVCGWDLAHNAAGRAHTLALIYSKFSDVEIIGPIFQRFGQGVWGPVRQSSIKISTFVVENDDKFIQQSVRFIADHPFDIVHLSKPRAPNIIIGVLYKAIWGATVLVDIDDNELALAGADTQLDLKEYIAEHHDLPSFSDLTGTLWTQLAVGLAKEFDGITVCNSALQAHFGGDIIRHARDFNAYEAAHAQREERRRSLGLPLHTKVVLFLGTPREHKGLIETAKAISGLGRSDVIFCIVGDFDDKQLKSALLQIDGCRYVFLPSQPFSEVPGIVACADCCVLLQDGATSVGQYQTPAKLTDALAANVPVLISRTKATEELEGIPGIGFASSATLQRLIRSVIENEVAATACKRGDAALSRHDFSLQANAETLRNKVFKINPEGSLSERLQIISAKIGIENAHKSKSKVAERNWTAGVASTGKIKVEQSLILAPNPDHHPDFFSLKASDQLADTVAVSWVSSDTEYKTFEESLKIIKGPFELVVLAHRDFAENFRLPRPPSSCLSITIVGFPGKTKRSGAVVRLINSGALWRYDNIVLLDSQNSTTHLMGGQLDLQEKGCSVGVGLAASFYECVDSLITEEWKGKLRTWYSRLHRVFPSDHVNVPQGNVFVKTGVARQIAGVSLLANKFDNLSDAADKDAFNAILCLLSAFSAEGSLSRPLLNEIPARGKIKKSNRNIKAIAFYLPQFHVVPENDKWWGKGFTEWNNVVRAKPLFRHHYQPRLPADLGFYDLRSNATQIAQAELARKFGIHGFCYYYYYFNGKKLLNEPIEQMLTSGKPDFPFCVCWANENWSRNWDGQNQHVLLQQNYSLESSRELIHEFIQMMRDKRYIRHEGKPVLLVYRIKIIPNWLETAAMWRDECRKAGIGEIHLCSIRFGLEPLEGMPQQHGLDAYVLFPPQDTNFVDVRDQVLDLNRDFGGTIYSYDAVVDGDISRFKNGYPWPVHRGAMMGWDNTARRLTSARIFIGCTPMRYRYWLDSIISQEEAHNPNNESLVFINAWNEWAEGTTLEPDQRYGTAYLEATRSVLEPYMKDFESSKEVNKSLPKTKKRYVKELSVPKLMEYWPGAASFNPSMPTVLLCAHVSGHHLFGGERSFLDVLEALCAIGLNVVVTLPSSNNKNYINFISNHCLAVYSFPYKQWIGARDPDPMVALQFCDLIATHNISIVYSNTIVLVEPAMAARKMHRVSVVHARELISIDDALRDRIGLSVQKIIRTVFERYDFLIANSRATEAVFARQGKTFYVPNAVNVDDLYMENSLGGRVRVGIVSSNIPKKGVGDFLEVSKICTDISEKVEFVVIGPINAQVEQWRRDVETGKLPPNIRFLGYRETPRQAMAELNILLNLSSFAESFGRTVAEAMAAGRPVIGYQWGALPELIQHNTTGFLAPYGDVHTVANYIRKFILHPDLIREFGESARRYVIQKYSLSNLRDRMVMAYTSIRKSPEWEILTKTGVKNRAINRVSVVVPVFNAPNEVDACIESVLRYTELHSVNIIVIDDGSTDPEITRVLDKYQDVEGVRVLRNESNIGYTRTVNRGIAEARDQDVVLLNSDTIVTPTWLNALRACAYSRRDVGTVTAMSDNAGAFSFPEAGRSNPKPAEMSHETYAMRLVDSTFECTAPEVPTGSGFCMYIRRDLLDEIGLFDEVLFPRGYGEENDFCMRALEAGWVNLVSPWAFVYHIRTASFKEEKDKLVKAGVDAVTKRYPSYAKQVKEAFFKEEMLQLRRASNVRCNDVSLHGIVGG